MTEACIPKFLFCFFCLPFSRVDFDGVSGLWQGPLFLHHLIWLKDKQLVAVGWDVMEQKDVLCQMDINKDEEGKVVITVRYVCY